ncbi:MAG: hypothetical protein AB7F20_13650 [Geoalkalibacter sp.]|uniref:hypothetical protein n=1 Tax=Geoalkalibacter sp. TaxID=3041440 RepID=UPI003D0CFA25
MILQLVEFTRDVMKAPVEVCDSKKDCKNMWLEVWLFAYGYLLRFLKGGLRIMGFKLLKNIEKQRRLNEET